MAKKKSKSIKSTKTTKTNRTKKTKKATKKTKKTKKKRGTSKSFFDDCITIENVDELYEHINKVQINLESSSKLQLNVNNYEVAINVIEDAGLPYKIYKTRKYLIRIDPDSDKDYNARVDESVNEFISEFFGTEYIDL